MKSRDCPGDRANSSNQSSCTRYCSQLPLGIGAALGVGGNHVFGRLTIRSARAIFGAPPPACPGGDQTIEAETGAVPADIPKAEESSFQPESKAE
jgi:hypothetical protein